MWVVVVMLGDMQGGCYDDCRVYGPFTEKYIAEQAYKDITHEPWNFKLLKQINYYKVSDSINESDSEE